MNLDTWDKTKWTGLKGKSGPPGNMDAFKHGPGGHSEAMRGEGHHRARGERAAADSGRFDSRQGRGSAGIDGHEDSSRGYRLGCRVAYGLQQCHRHIIQNNP